MLVAHGVGVVLGFEAVADDEDLGVFEEAVLVLLEAFVLVAFDLVEGFADAHVALLEFDVHEGQAVDEDGHVVAVEYFAVGGGYAVLVDDLHVVACGVSGVDEHDVAQGAVFEAEVDEAFFLDELGLLQDAVVGAGDVFGEQAGEFFVGEVEAAVGAVCAFFGAGVEAFELFAQVADERGFIGEARQVVVALGFEGFDEFGFELRFALVLTLIFVLGFPFVVAGCFATVGDDGEVV